MGTHKLSVSLCAGDFYLVGKVDIENINIKKNGKEYNISLSISEKDIKRLDDPELNNTQAEAKSNIIQIDFITGEKKWIN
jgi:hypothetical protein